MPHQHSAVSRYAPVIAVRVLPVVATGRGGQRVAALDV
jgi:hypothetical protein